MLKVTNKLLAVPALALTTVAAASGANALNNNDSARFETTAETISIYSDKKTDKEDSKTLPWEAWLGLGLIGGYAGTILTNKLRKNSNDILLDNNKPFLTGPKLKQYLKDREKFFEVEDEIIEKVQDIPTYLMTSEYFDAFNEFANKYPHTKEYLFYALLPYSDTRLSIEEASSLFRALVYKALATPEEWDYAYNYHYLDLAINYEEMVGEVLLKSMEEDRERILREQEFEELQKMSNEYKPVNGVSVDDAGKVNPKEKFDLDEDEGPASYQTIPANIKLSQVGAQKDAVTKIKRNILFPIKYPKTFKNIPVQHGFVLYGPPGTGKSYVVDALANESNAYYIKLNGSQLADKWVGSTEKNWRAVFKEAREHQPSIIFIDEFDSVAAKRGQGDTHGDKALNQVLGLLSDMEKRNEQVYVIAATNMLDLIDPAFIRSGRLGFHIKFEQPKTLEDITEIFDIHTAEYKLDSDVDKAEICKQLLKMELNGADIKNIVDRTPNNVLQRYNLYDKMDGENYQDSEVEIIIKKEDFDKAIQDFQQEKFKKSKIGFNSTKEGINK